MTHANHHYNFNVIIHGRFWTFGCTRHQFALSVEIYTCYTGQYSKSQNKSPGNTIPVFSGLVFGAILCENFVLKNDRYLIN